jgi:phage terminase large subunit GpA-like protein
MFELTHKYPDNIQSIINAGRDIIAPPSDITVTELADQIRVLPETANEAGKYYSSRTPHAQAIMDAFSDPEVEEISIQGSAQIAKTTILENMMAYAIKIMKMSMLFMAPTIDMAKKFSKSKFAPMVEDTPELKTLVSKKKSRDSDNTTLYKKFDGGFVVFVGANSPHGLRQMSIPIVISDDIDSIEIGSTKEGDPVVRAEKRTQTFGYKSKHVRASTPTIKDRSRIEKFRLAGTNERFYVKCPHCGEQQILKEENIIWKKDPVDLFGKIFHHHFETAVVACVNGCIITEAERKKILQSGKWIAEHPERKPHRSFWIAEINSTLSSLSTIAKAIAEAGDDPEEQQTLHNLVFGRTYNAEVAEEIDETGLLEKRENYLTDEHPLMPNGVLFITMGVDVQKDRIEYEIAGWGLDEECWSLVYGAIYGSFDDKNIQAQLDKVYDLKFTRDDGVKLNISRMAIDSGYQSPSKSVYQYARYRKHKKVFAVKGIGRYGKKLLYGASKVHKKTVDLYLVGTNDAKLTIYGRLQRTLKPETEPGPRFMHFNLKYNDAHYFEMLNAEKGIKKNNGFIEYIEYEKKKGVVRNEALDCRVYNYWAFVHAMCKMHGIKAQLDKRAAEIAAQKKEVEPIDNGHLPVPVKNIPEKESRKIIKKKVAITKRNSNYVTGR